jgi:hypothetical protein
MRRTGMRRRLATLSTAVLLAALPLAGCGGSGSGPGAPADAPTSTTPPAAQVVALQRTGGIAGNRDAVTVQPDGSWRRTGKTGVSSSGTLSADQRARLARMAADPALRTEATRTVPKIECADGFDYQLAAGGTKVAWRQCGAASKPPAVASSIAAILLSSTH